MSCNINNENDLIKALRTIDINKFEQMCDYHICKGYEYIAPIVKTLELGLSLTPPQIEQAKRFSKQIQIYHKIKDHIEF